MGTRRGTELVTHVLIMDRPHSPAVPVDVSEADAVFMDFVEALSHFAGETPVIATLADLLAPDAQIVVSGEDGDAGELLTREGWLASLASSDLSRGHFFEELERVTMSSASETRIGALLDERWTIGPAVERREAVHCSFDVVRVGERARIARLRIRKNLVPRGG
jgi:hypothetical protein